MNDQDRKTEDIKDAYQLRIESETGRKIELADADCEMCNAMGWSQFENPCTGCDGDRRVKVWVYTDCRHQVEGNECHEDGCEFVCEESPDGPGTHCDRAYFETVHEPYTPAAFPRRCCKECAQSLIDFGYFRKTEAA